MERHFEQASEDVRQIRISTEKISKRGERIEELQLDDAASEQPQVLPRSASK